MEKDGIATLLVFDPDWIRYITSTRVNDWANNKLLRSALMVAGQQPVLYELGSAIAAKKKLCPWIADRMVPSIGTWRGAFPTAVGIENAKKFARMVKDHLTEFGVQDEPVGIDLAEVLMIRALEAEGIHVVDGQQTLLDASKVKTDEEVDLIETSISIVEAAFWEVVNRTRPGVRESDIAGFMRETMYRLGAEEIQNINVISGDRAYPHPHDFSDRMLRMGDMLYIDVVSVFNGYKTCYYQTFVVGKPSAVQLDVYRQSYDWLFDAVAKVKPGVSTAEIAEVWPSYEDLGLSSEAEAFALQVAPRHRHHPLGQAGYQSLLLLRSSGSDRGEHGDGVRDLLRPGQRRRPHRGTVRDHQRRRAAAQQVPLGRPDLLPVRGCAAAGHDLMRSCVEGTDGPARR